MSASGSACFPSGRGMDLPFFFLLIVLLTIGLVMLFSASYPYAYYNMDGDSYYFIRNQAMYAVLGVAIMIAVSYFDYHHFHKLAIPLLLVTYLLLVAMLALRGSSFVPNIKGAYRWFYIGPFNFQPSELAKFALILIFSHLISLNYDKMNTFRYGVLPYALILGSVALLVVLEKHLSATLILLGLGAMMMFIGGCASSLVRACLCHPGRSRALSDVFHRSLLLRHAAHIRLAVPV